MNRLANLSISFAAAGSSACSDVAIDVVAATELRRQKAPGVEYSTDEENIV